MVALTFTNRIIGTILVFSLAFMGCDNKLNEVEKAKKVQKGMTKEQVIKIMGEPRLCKSDLKGAPENFQESFYYRVSIFHSEGILIFFDSSGSVSQVSLPKGTMR